MVLSEVVIYFINKYRERSKLYLITHINSKPMITHISPFSVGAKVLSQYLFILTYFDILQFL